jgi:hypothetical protein
MFPYREEIKQTVETDYSTNSLGFRTPERPFEKPPKTKRIITLGGSTTFDGPTNDQTWSALLEKRLNETYAKSGYKIEVINLAVDMASSPYSLVNLCFIGVSFQPDLVISYDGVNDSWIIGYQGLMPDYRSLMDKYDPRERTLQSKLPKWLFASYLVSFISHKIDASIDSKPDLVGQVLGRKVALLKPSENQLEGIQYFKRNLKLMRGISNEYGAKFLAATSHWVHPSDKVVAMNEDMRRFFEQEHIDFLDLDRLLPHDDYSIHVDAVHWSLKGEEMMAERWEAKIIETDALGLNAAR